MNCAETQYFTDSYLDGELDLAHSVEIENHLRGCDTCARYMAEHKILQDAVCSPALQYVAPAGLEDRIRRALPRSEEAKARPASFGMWPALGFAMAVILICAIFGTVRLTTQHAADSTAELVRELTDDHIRSLMAAHLADVVSTSRHTVKPWFAGKIDYSPPVIDLAPQGYPLTGGRLDYADHRPVAAMIYRHGAHVINLFVWPKSVPDSSVHFETEAQGYHLAHWTKGGMTYWTVSDLNPAELGEFARLIAAAS